jgi:S1-C subfamily serine protease
MPANVAAMLQIGSVNGVALIGVAHGSPAAATGFVPGDIITKVNDQVVVDMKHFQSGKLIERTVSLSN